MRSEAFSKLRPVDREVARPATSAFWCGCAVPHRRRPIDGAVLTFIDISALRRPSRSLHLGELQMQAVAESATDFAIITLDPEGRVTHWSRGAERCSATATPR